MDDFSIQIFAEFENENFKDCFEISFEKHVNLLTSIQESYSDKFLSTLLYPDFKRFLNESEKPHRKGSDSQRFVHSTDERSL